MIPFSLRWFLTFSTFFFYLLLQAEGIERTERLYLGSEEWSPFTDEPGKPRVALDIVEQALQRAGVAFSTEIVEAGTLTAALQSEEVDGSAALWKNASREEYLLFSEPYLENRLILVARQGTPVSAVDLEALEGRRIGIVSGYAYGPKVEEAEKPIFIEAESDEANLYRLLEGELDYILVDALLMSNILDRYRKATLERLAIGKRALIRRPLYFALRKEVAGARALLKAFNREIRAMQSDGTYNTILGLRWIQADVDGDGIQELVMNSKRGGDARPPEESYPILAPMEVGVDVNSPLEVFIEGRSYSNWEQVPQRFKTPADPGYRDEGVELLRIQF